MKLKIKYYKQQNDDIDWNIETMIEYFMTDATLIGRGYNHNTKERDMEYDVKLPTKITKSQNPPPKHTQKHTH